MLKIFLYSSVSILIIHSLISCQPFTRGFTFQGEYVAPQSGFLVRMIARGNIKKGSDVSDKAFSLVRVCPIDSKNGYPFDLSLSSEPDEWITMESKVLGFSKSEWHWKTSENLFKKALKSAGFNTIVDEEVKGSVRVINGSLAGPKGTILKGQIESIEVLMAKPGYGIRPKRGNPSMDWVSGMSLQPCEERAAQRAPAAAASRR